MPIIDLLTIERNHFISSEDELELNTAENKAEPFSEV